MSSSNVENRTTSADLHPLADEYVELVNSHDIDGLFALYAPDFRNHAGDGTTSGVQGTRAVLASFLNAVPDFAAAPVRVVAEGDWFAISFVLAGTNTGPFNGAPATGRSIKVLEVRMFKVADGKLTDHWGLIDLATLFAPLQS
ncbi:ester cyclase [Streptomyces mirabilis]|nr:ester cyclase [Streptomyces mirabilis]